MAKRKPPTREYLIALAQDAWQRTQPQRQLDVDMWDIFMDKEALEMPKDAIDEQRLTYVERRSGAAAKVVQRIEAMMHAKPPQLEIAVGNMTAADKGIASELKEALETWWQKANRTFSPWRAGGQHMLVLGRGVHRAEFVPQAWGDWPLPEPGEDHKDFLDRVQEFQMGAELPIYWQHVPANEFVPIFSETNRLIAGFWFGTRSVADVVRKYGKSAPRLRAKLADKSIRPLDRVAFTIYADDRYEAYMVGSTLSEFTYTQETPDIDLVQVFEHPLGMCPWVFMPGEQRSAPESYYHYLSILYQLRPAIIALDSVRSWRATTLLNYVLFPPFLYYINQEGMPTGQDKEEWKINLKHGAVVPLFKGIESIEALKYPGVDVGLDTEINLLRQEIHELGIAPMELLDPASSGVARSIAIRLAATRFAGFSSSMAQAAEELFERWIAIARYILTRDDAPTMAALYIDAFEARFGKLKLTKKHFAKPIRVRVTIPEAINPDLLAFAQYVTAMRQGEHPFLPDQTLYEMHGLDPAEMELLLDVQKLRRHPQITSITLAETARRLGLKFETADIMEALGGDVAGAVPPAMEQAMNESQAAETAPETAPQQAGAPVVTGRAPEQTQNQINMPTQLT